MYETYELSWNIQLQDYMNKNKREFSFEKVVARSSQNGATRTMPPPTPPSSRRSKTTSNGLVNEAITNLKRAMNNNSEDEFQQFANHIAAQLRQLLQNALLLQEKIRSLITKERISCMSLPSPLHVQIPQDVIYLSPSTSLSDQSNIENRDILQEAIISFNSEDFI
jgi:hypothetical protein